MGISLECRTKSGTFKEGDVQVNRKGLLVKGESPQSTPKNKSEIKPATKKVVNTSTHILTVIYYTSFFHAGKNVSRLTKL